MQSFNQVNQGSDNFASRIMKNHHEENSVFTYFGLIFYCYPLILVNELRANKLKFNDLKISKNEKTCLSIQNSQKGRFWEFINRKTIKTAFAKAMAGKEGVRHQELGAGPRV